jgi:hypothetical protein
MSRDERVSHPVVLNLLSVHVPIDLDRESYGVAVEVCDVSSDDLLTSELETSELVTTQYTPQYPFRWSHFFA